MGRLLALAIVAVLIYFALTQGMPWLQTAMGSRGAAGSAGEGESARCIAEAGAAGETVADELIPHARPPVDATTWGTALVRGAGALAAAEDACACTTAACATASDAVRELRALFDELDDLARGNPAGFGNPARRMERVYDLLDRARAQARAE